jgi:hypothetical protein
MTDLFALKRRNELERHNWTFTTNPSGGFTAERGELRVTCADEVDCVTAAGIVDEMRCERKGIIGASLFSPFRDTRPEECK